MKNPIIIFVLVTIVAAIGIGAYTISQKSSSQSDSMAKKDDVSIIQKDEGTMDKSAGSRYVEYSREAYDQAASKRRVLYFYATWCPSCKQANADFTANPNKIPEDVVVLRVNYNDPDTDQEEKDLAKKHGIIYQHTFVQIDIQGNQLTKWNGGQTDELLENIK
ncbi:MAG: thioredoxin domain-containing protein [Patescibacteria group bacterium]